MKTIGVDVVELQWLASAANPVGYVRVVPWMSEYEKFPELDRPDTPAAEMVAEQKFLELLDDGGGVTMGAVEVPPAALRWVTPGPGPVRIRPVFDTNG